MARVSCTKCHRPIKACQCHLFVTTENDIKLVLLQHPKEVNHPKGTAALLVNSLTNCEVIEGENFNDSTPLLTLLSQYKDNVFVLYPGENAEEISHAMFQKRSALQPQNSKTMCLIVIDATWKKAYKMFQLSQVLHKLPLLKLPQGIQGQYAIRSTKKEGALSTLEASCYALSLAENDHDKYQPLLNSFTQFNQFQLSLKD